MINDNPILTKIINGIDFEFALKFKVEKMKELTFIPIFIRDGAYYIAVSNNTNTQTLPDKIREVINGGKIEYFKLNQDKFDTLFKLFENKLKIEELKKEPHNQEKSPVQIKKQVQDGETPDPLDLFSEEDIEDDEIKYSDNNDEENVISAQDMLNDSIDTLDNQAELNVVDDEDENIVNIDNEAKRINSVKAPQTKKIGEILVEEGIITDKQLSIALAESKAQNIPLGSILVKLGYVTIQDLKDALGAQQGIELVNTEQLNVLPNVVTMLPEDFVKTNKVVPLSMTDKTLVVGMVNPGDTGTINEIVYQTGLKPTVMMITHYEYENFIKTYYNTSQNQAEKIIEEFSKTL